MSLKAKFFILGISFLSIIVEVSAQQIHIPEDYLTIQEGIDSSADGDTVLVFPGKYFENLNLRGKNIVLASTFITSGNLDLITQTVINGSRPSNADSASCILIVSGENENCVIAGFTITGGKGTRWEDEHNRGSWYTEGGGILIQYSSPTIRNNVIRDNEAILKNGRIVSAGGGGIRAGDSNPKILNNYIHHNQGRYGGGIVLNYSGAIIRNNLIVSNTGGQDFGGGGFWILGNGSEPRILENNTIVNNSSANVGGGVRLWNTSAILTNNIIRGNHGSSGPQVHGTGTVTYCNVEGGRSGEGNIDEVIRFDHPLFFLPDGDKSIDAGNPHASFNDPEDPESSGNPLFPSKGTLINDLGAYGGPGAMEFPAEDNTGIGELRLDNELHFKVYPNPAHNFIKLGFSDQLVFPASWELISINGENIMSKNIFNNYSPEIILLDARKISPGIYLIKVNSGNTSQVKRLVIN